MPRTTVQLASFDSSQLRWNSGFARTRDDHDDPGRTFDSRLHVVCLVSVVMRRSEPKRGNIVPFLFLAPAALHQSRFDQFIRDE